MVQERDAAVERGEDRSGRWAWFVLGGTLVVAALVVTQLVAAWRDDSAARALMEDLSPTEQRVLADRVVDADEMDEALRAWVWCQQDAGQEVDPAGERYGRSDYSRELGDAAPSEQEAQEAGAACDRENDAVEAVWFLQHDVGRGELGAARDRLVACVAGQDPAVRSADDALGWYRDQVTGPEQWDDRTALRACSAEVTAVTSSGFAPPGLRQVLEEADLG